PPEDVVRRVRERLQSDCVLVHGELPALTVFEDTLYPPDTPANDDFEILLGPTIYLAFARKTPGLRTLRPELSDEDWRRVLEVQVRIASDTRLEVRFVHVIDDADFRGTLLAICEGLRRTLGARGWGPT